MERKARTYILDGRRTTRAELRGLFNPRELERREAIADCAESIGLELDSPFAIWNAGGRHLLVIGTKGGRRHGDR